MQEKIREFIAANRENILADWRELVNLEGSLREPANMYRIAEHLREKFSEAGVDCQVYGVSADIPPVLAGVIGAGRPGRPVIFTGHFDTVFDEGTFGPEPFRIEGDRAYGPGVLDMKGGIIITLYVIKALESLGYAERPIRICFCGDEEGGNNHGYACKEFQKWADGCAAAFNMETAPVNNALCLARKYAMVGQAKVHGVSAHSGNNYPAGRNAIVEAAYKVIAIQNMNDLELGTNMNPAAIHGGTVMNTIPDECDLLFSGRFKLLPEAERVRKELEELFAHPDVEGTSIEYTVGDPMGGFEKTPENQALLKFIDGVCQAHSLPPVGGVELGGGSDAGNMSMMGVPTLCSCGVRGEWNHTDREYALVDSMYERVEMWSLVVSELDAFQRP
ncbi:MAG: M20/M25/M40 family metallo-hydrolase [Clostridiales bacterium]|nr:M20/M25/M40 family metallo-hydrolase [Clostridiales bacterium]